METMTGVEEPEAVPATTKENELLLDWTSKQGRILTCNGLGATYYTPERGYPFTEDELPHHHYLLKAATGSSTTSNAHGEDVTDISKEKDNDSDVFYSWALKQDKTIIEKNPVCGVWNRPLFLGGFEHSTDVDEIVFNVQTNTLFIDMRIPRIAKSILPSMNVNANKEKDDNMNFGLSKLTNDELRLYARRHAFAGYTKYHKPVTTTTNEASELGFCTRHHCIDWNLVHNKGRNRPNKWYVQFPPNNNNVWKELSFAKDEYNQHYYWEKWSRLHKDYNGNGLVLALRAKQPLSSSSSSSSSSKQKNDQPLRDGILVVVGDHFNYIFARDPIITSSDMQTKAEYNDKSNLVEVVDAAAQANDRDTMLSYLSIDAGHGTISSGWIIDHALQYWKEGTSLFEHENMEIVSNTDDDTRTDFMSCHLAWRDCEWDTYESSNNCIEDIELVLEYRKGSTADAKLWQVLSGHDANSDIGKSKKRKIG